MMLGDQGARDRIESVLDRNLLVEAGAGSGKTTALVGRMVALIRAGAPAESLVAVTFTRKAAGELRERFQDDLERATRKAMRDGDEAAPLLGTALRDIDRVFMGTIHAFCARLLRERPLEAGLDPAFSELTAPRAGTLAREWWEGWLERLANEGFRRRLRGVNIALAAIDEAHCISEWGHNFRPEYLKLARLLKRMRVGRILALTATATPEVAKDIRRGLSLIHI